MSSKKKGSGKNKSSNKGSRNYQSYNGKNYGGGKVRTLKSSSGKKTTQGKVKKGQTEEKKFSLTVRDVLYMLLTGAMVGILVGCILYANGNPATYCIIGFVAITVAIFLGQLFEQAINSKKMWWQK